MTEIAILHCAETIKGGVATYLRELLPLQVEAFGAGAIAIIIPASQICELPAVPGVLILPYKDKKNRVLNSLQIAKNTYAFLRKNPAKIVHIHSTFAGITLRPLINFCFKDIKIVYCPHGWAWDRPMANWKLKLTTLIERTLSFFCHRIICISEHEKSTAIRAGIKEKKLVVVLNGISSAIPTPSSELPSWPYGNKKLLFIGRFDYQKGVDIFCEALTLLDYRASGILVGDFVLSDSDQVLLPKNARQIGWLKPHELQVLYQSADILVIPSRWEGFGLVATEAMRAGLPVIASSVGGLPEVIDHDKTGLLVQPCNAQTLADAVNSLDRNSLIDMGISGKKRFNELFTIERAHKELLLAYNSL